jgi:ribosomal protein S18 acetylase RimI-like enzyme
MIKISKAVKSDLPEIAKLFDLYRQFYECEPNLELAKAYITERFSKKESTIFVAGQDGVLLGFVQLYPTYCSVEASRIFVLYDLFVDSRSREQGVGKLLMNSAAEYARGQGACRIDLSTATTNKIGQHLYEKLGYVRDSEFYVYSLDLL